MKTVSPIRIFIGWDQRENVAYHVLCNSIMKRSTVPVSITPLVLSSLRDYKRPRDPKQSNDFSFTRFMVPYLCGYSGQAIFMDCDMICMTDISRVFDEIDHYSSVSVVKHDYTPKNQIKFLGQPQLPYEKKNWSSFMVFNCSHFHTKKLTPDYINTAPALDLHQLKWTEEDSIGELSKEWNWLAGEYPEKKDVNIIHYTVGGPYFNEYRGTDYAREWYEEYQDMEHCDQMPDLVRYPYRE